MAQGQRRGEERREEKQKKKPKQKDSSEVDDGSLAAIRQMSKNSSHQAERRHFRQRHRHAWDIDVSTHIL